MYVCWSQGRAVEFKFYSLILDSSVGLSAGIQSAEDWVSETLWVRILHSAEEDNLSPFDSKIACLCQSIEINNNKYVCMYVCRFVSEHSVCWRIGVWDPGFKSCIQQRNTTCLLSIWISLACTRASKLTTTNMYIARARCENQLTVGSSGLNARWS